MLNATHVTRPKLTLTSVSIAIPWVAVRTSRRSTFTISSRHRHKRSNYRHTLAGLFDRASSASLSLCVCVCVCMTMLCSRTPTERKLREASGIFLLSLSALPPSLFSLFSLLSMHPSCPFSFVFHVAPQRARRKASKQEAIFS